jgi:hypothetical protein
MHGIVRIDEHVYVFGGVSRNRDLKHCEVHSLRHDTWEAIPEMPEESKFVQAVE